LLERLFGIHDSDVPVSSGNVNWSKYIVKAEKAQSKNRPSAGAAL